LLKQYFHAELTLQPVWDWAVWHGYECNIA